MGKCPHCGSRNVRRRYREHERYKWRCRNCNGIFRAPRYGGALWLIVAAVVVVAASLFAVQQGMIALPETLTPLDEAVDRISEAVITAATPVATMIVKADGRAPKSTPIPTNSTSYVSKTKRESQPQIDIEDLEALTHNLINAERTKQGLRALKHDRELTLIARNHSLDMAKNDYFSHDNLKGQDPTDRGKSAGYDCFKDYGSHYTFGLAENIYQGGLVSLTTYINGVPFDDWFILEEIAAGAVESWMKSPWHRENILDSSYDGAGLGVAIADDGKVYFTQVFC